MRLVLALILALGPVLGPMLAAAPALARGERAGDFDYYVLSLSWSPNWCTLEGEARRSPQCAPGAGFGWVVHGLWPQYERGWPSYCRTTERPPARSLTAAQADIFGSTGSAWYQWKKHGTCAGLAPEEYFGLAREAWNKVNRPEVLRRLERPVDLPARVIEEAFLRANPGLSPDMVTVTCKQGHVQEVRLCLTRDLAPRVCGADVRRDCTLGDARLEPLR